MLLKYCLVVIAIVTTAYIGDFNLWNEVQASLEFNSLPLGSKLCILHVQLSTLMIIIHADKILFISL